MSRDPGSSFQSRTVVYDKVLTNIGSGYNAADGIFTASRAGIYLFIWNSMTNRGQCFLYFYKNGVNTKVTAFSDATSAFTDTGSSSLILELKTGDRVWIHDAGCSFLYGREFLTFTGCKI